MGSAHGHVDRAARVRWLQQAEAGTLALEDEEEEDEQDFAAFDVGPPELRYEDFEALLRDPMPAEVTTAPPNKAAIPPSKVNRPRGSVQTAKKAPLSSFPLTSSSLDSSTDETAPQLLREAAPEARPPQAASAEIPALLRPAAPRLERLPAAVDEEQKIPAEAQIKLAEGRLKDIPESNSFLQTEIQTLQDPRAAKSAETATAAELAKANGLPPLELISRPLPKKAVEEEPSSPTTWGAIDFDKFTAENPKVAANWSKSRWIRAAIKENRRLAGLPQLPPPPLADRPARAQLDLATSAETVNTARAEWDLSVVMRFAVKAQDAHSQFTVPVVSANSGGVVVRSQYFRGFIPTAYLNSASSFKVLTQEKAIRKERGLETGCTEEESRSMRKQALRTLLGDVLTATIVQVSETHLGNPRVIMTARILRHVPEHAADQKLPSEALAVLQQNLGEVVEGIVTDVPVFGCFMEFDVDVGGGRRQPVSGLVHNSELTWQYCEDARTIIKTGAPIEAVLIGVDTSSGKVWLSMRQVQPDPLQETLNALLAQGPPDGGAGGPERAELTCATDLSADPADVNEDKSMMPLQEALDVAEALVLLPEVDSVAPGRQMYTRARAQDLQVFLSSAAWLDVAASFAQQDDAHLKDPDDELDDREAEDNPDADLSKKMRRCLVRQVVAPPV
ncbi:hypothetical protein WJX79_010408 [Trebouxia sp. C0005]